MALLMRVRGASDRSLAAIQYPQTRVQAVGLSITKQPKAPLWLSRIAFWSTHFVPLSVQCRNVFDGLQLSWSILFHLPTGFQQWAHLLLQGKKNEHQPLGNCLLLFGGGNRSHQHQNSGRGEAQGSDFIPATKTCALPAAGSQSLQVNTCKHSRRANQSIISLLVLYPELTE